MSTTCLTQDPQLVTGIAPVIGTSSGSYVLQRILQDTAADVPRLASQS